MNALAASRFLVYFMTPQYSLEVMTICPLGPAGRKSSPMSSRNGILSLRATHQILAPFWVAATVSARNARLLEVSSQATPVSSYDWGQASLIALTAATVSGELMATFPC